MSLTVLVSYRSLVHANNIVKLVELASCEAIFASLDVVEKNRLAAIQTGAVSLDAAIGADALFIFSCWPFHASVVVFRLVLELHGALDVFAHQFAGAADKAFHAFAFILKP